VAVIEIKKDPSERELTWFGVLLGVFFALVGAMAWWRFDAPGVARVLWGLGILLPAVFFLVRPLRKPMYLGWTYLFFPIGWFLSHLLLTLIYYLLLTPLGWLMRLVAGDPMRRLWEPEADTYWVKRPETTDAARYFRQY
jgi:hypothetical protein